LEPRKGIADLVAAFDKLSGAHELLELVLAGATGWKAEPILAAIADSPNHKRIRRIGYVADSDVPALLRRARAVVYPSLEEGFGLPALEALACGTALVTTQGTSMAELAGDGALLVPVHEPDALAKAIETVLVGAETSQAARRRAIGLEIAAGYTWAACAEGHMVAYRSAAGA
jgi:glycosyltransferase involved in cell wall biosynthesis